MSDRPDEVKNRWWLVAAVGIAVFMAVLDTTIVGVALPVIGRDFDKPPSVTEWVVLGYALPMIALLLPTGRWLDTVGRRPALAFGAAGFALASAAAGAAQSAEWLIAARVVQGGFGSVLFAVGPAIAATAVRPEVRGRAMGIIGTIGPLGGITGRRASRSSRSASRNCPPTAACGCRIVPGLAKRSCLPPRRSR